MELKLSNQDLHFILESLQYTKIKFEDYDSYPSPEFKQQRIKEVETIITKVQSILKETQ